MTYYALVAEFKRRVIAHALAASGGSVAAAARLLALNRVYLRRLIREFELPAARYRCAACRHWWGDHCAAGCRIVGCGCRVNARARPASTTQQVGGHRPRVDAGRQPRRL
jgi:hypothetical protein